MDILIILAIIGIVFGIGKYSIQMQLINKSIIDYSKPVGTIKTFIDGILITLFILLILFLILFLFYIIS